MTRKRHRRPGKPTGQTRGPDTASGPTSDKRPAASKVGERRETRNTTLVSYLLLAAALICGVSLRVAAIAGKGRLVYDEPISYLTATGQQGEYAEVIRDQAPPYGVWAKASEWKRFVRIDRKFCFKTIGSDLARHDIHPPLYFWLLHLWCLVFGIHLWTGPALNVLFALLSTVALFHLARHVLRNAVAGALVAFIWNVSPCVLQTGLIARQYDLFALCVILFVWCVVRCTDPHQPCGFRQFILLALLTAMGLSTHYQFCIVALGGGLFALYRLVRKYWQRLAAMGVAVSVGIVIFAVLHPGFVDSVERARREVQSGTAQPIAERASRVLTCYTGFFVDSTSLPAENRRAVEYAVLAGVAAMALMLVGSWGLATFGRRRSQNGTRLTGLYILYFLVWAAGTNILLYLASVTPEHAMTPRYPAMVWPFLAFLPVLALGTMHRAKFMLGVLLSIGMLFAGIQKVRDVHRRDATLVDPSPLLNQAQELIVDCVRRGTLPRAIWHCPDDLKVLAATQEQLLAHKDTWVDQIETPAIYLSPRSSRSSREDHAAILSLLKERYDVAQMPRWFWNLGVCYWIADKP